MTAVRLLLIGKIDALQSLLFKDVLHSSQNALAVGVVNASNACKSGRTLETTDRPDGRLKENRVLLGVLTNDPALAPAVQVKAETSQSLHLVFECYLGVAELIRSMTIARDTQYNYIVHRVVLAYSAHHK